MRERSVSLITVALAAFLPSLIFTIGEGAIIPIIPVVANNLGAGLALAGIIAGMVMIGKLIGDIPGGWITSRIGERKAMIYASLLSVAGLLTAVLAPNPWLLTVGIFLVGLGAAVFSLARHAFMTIYVPVAYRARALSSLAGTFYFGYFVGPLVSAGVIHLTGSSQSVFWIHIVACLVAAGILLFLPDPATTLTEAGEKPEDLADDKPEAAVGLFRTIWRSRAVLLKLGSGAALMGAMRASRQVIMPLWAVSIAISDSDTALIIGIAGGIDFALFYVGGHIMDRFGRVWTAVPSMIGMGVGFVVLAFTHELPGRVAWFLAIAAMLSVANGIVSGLRMTLGADLADKNDPAPFLGAWRFTGDAGSAAAPLAISLLTALGSLAIASGILGILGLIGAGIFARYIPRYTARPPRAPSPVRRLWS